MSRNRRVALVVAALVVVAALAHHAVMRALVPPLAGALTGTRIGLGDYTFDLSQLTIRDLRVQTRDGAPLLEVPRAVVRYSVDALWQGRRAFGLRSVDVERPVLSLLRHADGSFALAGVLPSGGGPGGGGGPPLRLDLRVRDGVVRLIDERPGAPDLAEQTLDGLTVDAHLDGTARSTVDGRIVLHSRPVANAPLGPYPITVRSTSDARRGFSVTRARAARIPLRGLLTYLIHAPVARFDAGSVDDVDVVAYALQPNAPLRLGGGARLHDAHITIDALAEPIEHLGGALDLFDDGVTTRGLDGTIAGIPLRVQGGVYDFAHLQFRIGVGGDAELGRLKLLFAFLRPQRVAGPLHLETLIEGGVADPLIRSSLFSPRAFYDRIPLDRLRGVVDYEHGGVTFTGIHTGFGPLDATINGNVDVSEPNAQIEAFVAARGPASGVPYAQAVASDATLDVAAAVNGSGRDGFRVGGPLLAAGPDASGEGFIRVDERGQGEFGPFVFRHRDGRELAGAMRLDRTTSESAAWLWARGFRLDIPARLATLPGVDIPPFPQVGGRIDADVVAGGNPSDFVVAGRVHAEDAGFQRYHVGTADLGLGGTLADLRLEHIRVDGPIGSFRGDGAVHGGLFALGGHYRGSLEALRPFTGEIGARGPIDAPVVAVVDAHGITIQTAGAAMAGAAIRGFPIDAAAGTLQVGPHGLRIVAADATVRGRHAVAAADGPDVALAATDLPASALRAAGIPVAAGTLSLFGVASTATPGFHGGVDLADGIAGNGYPIGGWAELQVAGTTLRVRDGSARLGDTYAELGGRLTGIETDRPRYDLRAEVPLGDAGGVVHDLRLPVRNLEGTFRAGFAVGGSGGTPALAGTVFSPEAAFNGLPIAGTRGRFRIDVAPSLALRLDDGAAQVHQTRLTFGAAYGPGGIALRAASRSLDLADFDDFFDQSALLDGRGPAAFDLTVGPGRFAGNGAVALVDTRVGHKPFGDVRAAWRTVGGTLQADLAAAGPAGRFAASGNLVPSRRPGLDALVRGRLDSDVHLAGVDLATWLTAFGFDLPLAGRLSADGHVRGAFPHLAIGGQADVTGGRIAGYPVTSATLRTHAVGETVTIDDALVDLGFVRLSSSGSFGVAGRQPLDVHVHASVPDLADAAARLTHDPMDVAGALETDALLSGSLAHPTATIGADLENARFGQFRVRHIIGDASTDLHHVRLDSAEIAFERGTALVAGSIPLSLDPPGVGPPSAPLSLTAEARAVDLAPLAPLLPGTGTKLGGTLDGRIALTGTVHAPRIFGNATLSNGAYVSDLESSPIAGLDARLAFEGTSIALEALHASVGHGTIDGSGRLALPLAEAPPTGYAIDLTARGAQIVSPTFGGGTIDGGLAIVSGPRRPTLSGNVTLSDTTIPFAAIFRATGGGSAESEGPPFDLGLDLRATAGKNVRIRSPIIDVAATGEIRLLGTLLRPRASGTLTASRGGYFSTYQRLFRIQDATVTFDPAQGIVPNLDLHAAAHVTNPDPDTTRNAIGSADITVSVVGPADNYVVSYASQPAYSQTQILALLAAIPFVPTVNYGAPQVVGTLRGAPGESNVLLPPGVTLYQGGAYTFQQEAFSLFNTQLTQRLFSPIENAFGGALGLDDLELTLDYGGRVGFTARKAISTKHPIALDFSQILSYPTRSQFGFTARPDAQTSFLFSYFTQNGTPSYQNSIFGNTATVQVLNGVQPLSNRQGFSAVLTRRY